MTDQQVLVNVDDLQVLRSRNVTLYSQVGKAIDRLVAAIPGPAWEPSADQVAAYAEVYGYQLPLMTNHVQAHLCILHNVGLIP